MPDNNGCGKHRPKAGVDWTAIEAGIRGGASHGDMAKVFPVSRQRISAKAKKEGWNNPRTNVDTGNKSNITFLDWINDHNWGKLCVETISSIHAMLSQGLPEKAVVSYHGIPERTWFEWREKEEALDLQIRAAKSAAEIDNFEHIGKAKQRGDWKAAERLLTLNPDHRQTYGDQERVGSKITVNINIPDPGTEIVGEIIAQVSG